MFYYELEALEQQIWKEEDEREARLKRYAEVAKEHWKEVAALRKLAKQEPDETESGSKDECLETFSYDNLHLAYYSD